jgi:hypothetical protein
MATSEYMIGRKTYQRPQALCFSETEPIEEGGMYVPEGEEFSDFIILSDHNRSSINLGVQRIGTRKRTINGRMRSYWTADKLTISTSWDMLPSRGWRTGKPIGETAGTDLGVNLADYSDRFTVDGGAGGNELLEWYRGHTGSFWVLLAYDRYPIMGTDSSAFTKMWQYNEKVEMFLTDDFNYEVVKRGAGNQYQNYASMDFWNIDLKLEEA